MKIQFFLQLQVFKGIPSEASFVSFDLMGTILVERMSVVFTLKLIVTCYPSWFLDLVEFIAM